MRIDGCPIADIDKAIQNKYSQRTVKPEDPIVSKVS